MLLGMLAMMSRGNLPPLLPSDTPKPGETYRHYKGDLYKVVLIALHSNDEEWMVVYQPMSEHPDAPFFTRPLRDWSETVERNGALTARFTKLS